MRKVAACVALLMGVPATASADNFVRTVPAGQKTKMHLYLSWKTKDCSPNKAIVKVLTKPLHGKLTAGDGEGRAQRSRHTKDDPCIGKMMKGLQVEYESELGYRGSDNFQIQVTFGNRRPEIDTYIVRERAGPPQPKRQRLPNSRVQNASISSSNNSASPGRLPIFAPLRP